jgi:hypothetical protein
VNVQLADVGRDGLERLRAVFAAHPGPCDAFLHLLRPNAPETVVALPEGIRVAASEAVIEAVERVVGSGMLSFR